MDRADSAFLPSALRDRELRFEISVEPRCLDLAPALPRSTLLHQDGGTERPVQWYFDNLLPEEQMREALSKEAKIHGDDAFALLEYLGAESAGSLVLLPPDKDCNEPGGLRPISDEEIARRIRNLPRATLGSGAPKRMPLAGAQNKLLVVYRDGVLFEPVGGEPSTHILKPNHVSDDCPASVINEYVVMRLAHDIGLPVPLVFRRYTPEPICLIVRFDRRVDSEGRTQCRHIIDACQLLKKSRAFKYQTATLQTLAQIVERCRSDSGSWRLGPGSRQEWVSSAYRPRRYRARGPAPWPTEQTMSRATARIRSCRMDAARSIGEFRVTTRTVRSAESAAGRLAT